MKPHPPAASACASRRPGLIAGLLVAVLAVLPPAPAWAKKPAPEAPEKPPGRVGFELGVFSIKDYRPIQGEKVRLRFTLHAACKPENARQFRRRLESRRMRVRDQVITAMRVAEPLEFKDPELRLIRRRLYLRLGRALPELAVEDVYFSDFSYLVD